MLKDYLYREIYNLIVSISLITILTNLAEKAGAKKEVKIAIQFADKNAFIKEEAQLYKMLADSEGDNEVVIYCKAERAIKRLPRNKNIQIDSIILSRLTNYFGESDVKVVEKSIEKGQ